MSHLRLATRRSPLAVAQAERVALLLLRHNVTSEIVLLDSQGDRDLTTPLREIAGAGVFAVEIQRAVLEGRADLAVHSAKDLPSDTPEGLTLASVPEREDPRDVLVGNSLAGLGPGATVATGSPRRRAVLLERRPDLNIVELRGNMERRLASVHERGIDAIVTAAAALVRLGQEDQIAEFLDPQWCIPQVGQGALAIEARSDDTLALAAAAALNDQEAWRCVMTERAFLRELGAGCSIPAAAHARRVGVDYEISGIMAAVDGSRVLRATHQGHLPDEVGRRLANILRDELGGGELEGWSS